MTVDVNRYMEKLEAQARAHSEPYAVDSTLSDAIEKMVTNGRGYLRSDAQETSSTSYQTLGQSLRRMDAATRQDNVGYTEPRLQDMRTNLDFLQGDIKTYGLQWVYGMIDDAPRQEPSDDRSVRNTTATEQTISRMARLKRDMDNNNVPAAYRTMAFASRDSVGFAWRMREFGMNQARNAIGFETLMEESRLSEGIEKPSGRGKPREEIILSSKLYEISEYKLYNSLEISEIFTKIN